MTRAAITTLLNKCIKHQHLFIKPSLLKSHSQRAVLTSSSNPFTTITTPFQVRRESDKAVRVGGENGGVGFDEMVSGTHRRYYMLVGKGGVGKTSCAASLAVKFASHGHPTMVVSTDPAHSLSDSFAQDLSGGGLVPIQGVDTPLFAMEINAEKSREALSEGNRGTEVRDVMSGMGLGMLADKFGDLKMEELFDVLPPGLDEVIAIHKVMEFAESQQYNKFTRIVFDTAPTGHTLRLLSLPDFMDGSIGKMMRLKKKLSSATSAIKSVFGKKETPQNSSESDNKLEQIKEKMGKVRDLFHNPDTTELIIVTIPTVMAISESSRLGASLRKENVPVRRLVVNQVIPQSASGCKFCSVRHKDQKRSMEMIQNDAELGQLRRIEAPMVDAEIRGVPALKFMGDLVWR